MSDTLLLNIRIKDAQLARAELRSISNETERVGVQAKRAGELGRGLGGIGRGLRGMGAAVGVTGLAFGIKDLVEAGARYQQQTMNLQATVKQAGLTNEDYTKTLEAATSSTEHGGFARDQEIQSVSNFLTVTKNASAAVAANQAAVELSRGAGLNFASVQRYIQQALVGNVRRLTQYTGAILPIRTHMDALNTRHKWLTASLEAQAKAMGAGGAAWLRQHEILNQITGAQRTAATLADRAATAQEVLLRVHEKFSNRVAKYNQSTQGQLNNLRNTWEETMAQIGQAILPLIQKILPKLTWLIGEMGKHKRVVIAVAAAITALGAVAFAKMLVGGIIDVIVWLGRGGAAMLAFASEAAIELGLADLAMAAFGVTAGVAITIATGGLILVVAAVAAAAIWIATHFKTVERVVSGVFSAVKGAAVTAWHWVTTAASDTWHWITDHWHMLLDTLEWPFKEAWKNIKKVLDALLAGVRWVVGKVVDAFKFMTDKTPLGIVPHLIGGAASAVGKLAQGDVGGAAGELWKGQKAAGRAATFGVFGSRGGRVPRHFQFGGPVGMDQPVGTDTVPSWLTPGEFVVTQAMANRIGAPALSQLEAGNLTGFAQALGREIGGGGGAQTINVVPGQVVVKLDSRTIAQAVVEYTLRRAARGPSSLVGGALVTGASGPAVR